MTVRNPLVPSVIAPVFVKLGLVPVCVTVRLFAPLTAIVPLFTCAALACASTSGPATVISP